MVVDMVQVVNLKRVYFCFTEACKEMVEQDFCVAAGPAGEPLKTVNFISDLLDRFGNQVRENNL
jgi:hypothetical protein